VPYVNNIRILEVTVDLSFDQHVSDAVISCNYHIRSLRHLRPLIDQETAVNLACSTVASRLNYCNSVSYGVSETNIAERQRKQNNLARVVHKLPNNINITELLRELHWLPVRHRIIYKLQLLHIARKTTSNLVYYWTRISQLEHYARQVLIY